MNTEDLPLNIRFFESTAKRGETIANSDTVQDELHEIIQELKSDSFHKLGFADHEKMLKKFGERLVNAVELVCETRRDDIGSEQPIDDMAEAKQADDLARQRDVDSTRLSLAIASGAA